MTTDCPPGLTEPDAEGRVGTEAPWNALAIDTTSDTLSLALLARGRPAGECHEDLGRRITQTILPRIDDLLQAAGLSPDELNAVLLGRGPGSFTGTRIGLAVGLTFAHITGCPAVGVESLRLLAAQADAEEGQVFDVLLNCARDEVYHARVIREGARNRLLDEIALTTIHALHERDAETFGEIPVVLRRFKVRAGRSDEATDAAFAALRAMPLRYAAPDAWRLMAEGLPDLPADLLTLSPDGMASPPRVEPLYLKSEAFRTWKPAS